MERLTHFVVRYPWAIIAGFLLVTAAMASRIPTIDIETQVKAMLPADMPARINLDRIEELFGGTDMVMLVLSTEDVLAADTLRRVRDLSRRLERTKNVDRVMSLFTLKEIRAEAGDMVVESAVLHIPESDDEREQLRQRLRDNDLVFGNVVAEDFSATVIIAMLNTKANDNLILAAIDDAVKEVPGSEKVILGGMPFVRTHVGRDIRGDMQRFLPFSLIIMMAFLIVAFRQIRGMALPAFVVVMSILFAFGLAALLGWKVHIVTVLLPLILVAVANDYGIHLYARYQEENIPTNPATRKEIARSIVSHLVSPVIITGVTTVGGLLCLLSHIAIPARELGILAAAGVTYALAGSLLFIPAVLSLTPKAKPVRQAAVGADGLPLLERLLAFNARFVTTYPRRVIAVLLTVVAVAAIGLGYVVVDTNPINYYEADAPVSESARVMNDKFGGSTSIAVVATGDMKDPALLRQMSQLEERLDALDQVGQVSSVAKVVKRMNRAMHDGKEEEERLPDSREAVAQYFLTYSFSGDPEDFDRLVDFPFENGLLTARINTLSTNEIAAVVQTTEDFVAENPDAPFSIVGGFASVFADLVDAVVFGQVVSLVLSLLVVGILVALLFRSAAAGVLAVVPLVLAMGVLFGLMGFLGIELNVPTALLSSIMIGVGVDYTIHFFWRYRDERRAGMSPEQGLIRTLTTSGRGIVFNALSVIIGFAAVLLSSFLPVRFFGFLIVVSIGSCLVGAMVLLPAVALAFRPKFLEPNV